MRVKGPALSLVIELRDCDRELAHVVDDHHRAASMQGGSMLRAAMAPSTKADRDYPGGTAAETTCRTIFDHQTAVWWRREPLCRIEEQIGRRLAAGTIVALNSFSPNRASKPVKSSFRRICSGTLLDTTHTGSRNKSIASATPVIATSDRANSAFDPRPDASSTRILRP